jgi:glycosyltransferase involved in cell wall biosynthesis
LALTVVHVASGDLWAGAEVQLHALVCGLQAFPEVRTHVVLLNDGELAARVRSAGIGTTILDEGRLNTLRLIGGLREVLVRVRADVVHTHRTKENVIGAIAALTAGIPSIRTSHGAPEHAKKAYSRARVGATIDATIARHVQKKVVAVSHDLAASLRLQFGAARVACIPNGIDPSVVRSAAASGAAPVLMGTNRVGFVGRLVQVKRLDLFLRAAQICHLGAPDAFRFYIIGDGPLRAELEVQARALGLESVCEFLGFQANCLPIMAHLDALVFTSDHEGLPMAALEALALGVPVVAHAVGGLPELIDSSARGHLVTEQDPEHYAAGIRRVLASRSPRAGATSLLPEAFLLEACCRRYVALYQELRGSQRG